MKRIIAIFVCLMLMIAPAFAEAERTFVVDTDIGTMLITESGAAVTAAGEYDSLTPITYGDCPPERMLYAVSSMDIGDGMFLDGTLFDGGEEDWEELFPEEDAWLDSDDFGGEIDDEGQWEDVPEDVEAWPEGEGGLDEDYDMEVVEDEQWPDEDIEAGEWPEEIAADDEWEDPFADVPYEEDYFGFDSYNFALMSADGRLLTGFDYISFEHDVKNGVVAAYDFNGFVTMLDENGTPLASGSYTSVVSDTNGGFFAIMPTIDAATGDLSVTAPIVHIAATGDIAETGLYTFSFEQLPGFSEGLMCVSVCSADATEDTAPRYVYIDVNGTDVFGRSFAYASNFVGGCAEVYDDYYSAGLIDRSGEYAVSGDYAYFEFGSDASVPVIGNLMSGGFDIVSVADGSFIGSYRPENGAVTLYAFHSGDGLIMAYSDAEMFILDTNGEMLYRGAGDMYAYTWYEYADSRPERLLMTGMQDEEMLVCVADFDGAQKSGWYKEITALSWIGGEGRYLVGNYELIEVAYDDVIGYEPDPSTYRYGVIDQDGNTVIEMNYEYFVALSADRYWVCDNEAYMLMDADGAVLASYPR